MGKNKKTNEMESNGENKMQSNIIETHYIRKRCIYKNKEGRNTLKTKAVESIVEKESHKYKQINRESSEREKKTRKQRKKRKYNRKKQKKEKEGTGRASIKYATKASL